MTSADTIRLDQLDARIRSVWGRGQALHLVAGLLAWVRWFVPLWLTSVFIDWMTYMPAAGRVVMLVVVLGVALYRAWRAGWRHLRPFNAVYTALQLETHHGELQSLLVSAIQLRDHATVGGGSAALRDRTCRLAEEAASTLRPDQAVPYRPLHRPSAVALVLFALIGVFAVVNGPFLAAAAARFLTPWLDTEYPTRTQLDLAQEQMVIKEGDNALIKAAVTGVVPEQATIFVRTGEGKARAIDLQITDGQCAYPIASASRDFTYRIKAGDDRTAWHTVRVVSAPRIEKVQVDQAFPAYLQRGNESVQALTLTVPESTQVHGRLTLDKPVRAAQIIRDGEPPIDLPVSEDGREVTFTQAVSASRGYNFAWVDREHGFHFTSPRYYLQVASDQPPRVELTSPAANMVAMLGRPLNLVVRAQDDHGIAAIAAAYRVNQHDEVTADLSGLVQTGPGEQPIDWDYRKVMADLQIGDTVSFTIQASDHYPGPQGPHRVRSETRRVTFLSKEQYLEQIQKQKDRLLSRVQTIYRQQRSAHETVRHLDPAASGYTQACQLEAIRQEMVREQLNDIADLMQALLDDLAANGVADQGQSLDTIRAALRDIAQSHIANAASLLRDQSGNAGQGPEPAARAVNTAARELGALVMLRGIDSAQEVYAREARMLAQAQASLRWAALTQPSADKAAPIAGQQDELAQWTERLIADLQGGMRYDKRPLAVLRLTRSVKDLGNDHTPEKMREAADMIRQGRADQAQSLQADLSRTLLNAEFSVRLSGAYSTLMQTRNLLNNLAADQAKLRAQGEAMSADAFKDQQRDLARTQTALRKQLLTLLLPTIPAPRAQLFDQSAPQTPPVRDLLAQADQAMAGAWSQLNAGKQTQAAALQAQAEQALVQLAGIVDRWSVEMGIQTQGLGTLVAATSDRMSQLEAFESRTIGLLEKTDIADAEQQKVAGLAEPQSILADELAGFRQDLARQHRDQPDPDLPPLLSRLDRAAQALNQATRSLDANEAAQAIGHQERAADALAQAYAIVTAQNERLSLLQDLLMFQRAVAFANGYMADIVAEQRDLLSATKTLKPQDVPGMMPKFDNMRACLVDVAPLLDMVAGRLDVGTPLVFAKTDFEDAMASLQVGDQLDAVDAQQVAAESLASVQLLVQDVQTQTGYVAEIVAFLHAAVSDAAVMQDQQELLQQQAASAKPQELPALVTAQRALLERAQELGGLLESATGMPQYTQPATPMREALARLQANDPADAAVQMQLVSEAYTQNAESLFAVITMLHGLPSIEVTAQTEPELIRLVDALALASSHKQLLRQTRIADASAIDGLAQEQRDLAARGQAIAKAGPPNPLLTAAADLLSQAASAFGSADADDLVGARQWAGDTKLRHFIVEQALILETAVPPAAAEEGAPTDDGPGSDGESEFAAGFISDFVSGEVPQDKRTEWKVLADRNRAALNQNFARELPLEYRGLLKNYYERVAE